MTHVDLLRIFVAQLATATKICPQPRQNAAATKRATNMASMAQTKKEGVSSISRLKFVAMATSLDQLGNQYQIKHLPVHQRVYHP